jgi:hypothetical protein
MKARQSRRCLHAPVRLAVLRGELPEVVIGSMIELPPPPVADRVEVSENEPKAEACGNSAVTRLIDRLVEDADRLEKKLIAIRHPIRMTRTKPESKTGDVELMCIAGRPAGDILDDAGISTDARDMEKTTIMRAFELARSGTCGRISDIRKRLHTENYADVNATLAGQSLQLQLKTLMKASHQPS